MIRNSEFGKFSTMPLNCNADRSLPPKYEKNIHGDIDYVCTVDVDSFSPADIRVEQTGTMLIIEAKKSKSGSKNHGNGSSEESEYKEFKKEIGLPSNIDTKRELKSIYNDNGLLEIRIPTLPQSYSTLYPPIRRPISIHRHSPQQVSFDIITPQMMSPVFSSSTNAHNISPRPLSANFSPFHGSTGSVLSLMRSPIQISDKCKQYSEEIQIDPIYKPEELTIKTKGSRVIINAKHEELGTNGYSNVKEFSDEHDLPSNIELDNLKATLIGNGILLIEAPYKPVGIMKTPITVHRG